jgi:large subunit ribosomal protein L10
MPTAEKIAVVDDLAEMLSASAGIYLADFTGLDVPTFTQLRKRLREEEVGCRVVKNRLAKLAAKKAGIEGMSENLEGPTSLLFARTDPVAPARVLTDFAKTAGGLPKIKVGLVEGKIFTDDQLEALAMLPSREELLGQTVSALQSPISGLAYCLGGVLKGLVLALNAIVEKRQGAGDDPDSPDAS